VAQRSGRIVNSCSEGPLGTHVKMTSYGGATWKESLKAQAKTMVGCGFFHVDTVVLRRLYVLVFIDLDSRAVLVARTTTNPTAAWVTRQAGSVIASSDLIAAVWDRWHGVSEWTTRWMLRFGRP
jgi:hypothetical protein